MQEIFLIADAVGSREGETQMEMEMEMQWEMDHSGISVAAGPPPPLRSLVKMTTERTGGRLGHG